MTLYRLHEADLEIPDAWQDQSINIFKLPASGPAREASFVISRDASQGDAPFADYVARQLENAEKQLPGFKLHKRWDINIHGHAAVLLDYQWQREGPRPDAAPGIHRAPPGGADHHPDHHPG